MVDYIGTARVREFVSRVGPARFIEALAGEIEADYLRWNEFEKSSAPCLPFDGRRDRAHADERWPAVFVQVRERPSRRTPPRGC